MLWACCWCSSHRRCYGVVAAGAVANVFCGRVVGVLLIVVIFLLLSLSLPP